MNDRVDPTPRQPGAGARSAGPQGTRLYAADELRRLAEQSADIPGDAPASVQVPVLEGLGGAQRGLRFRLRSGRQTVGRSADNDIVVDDLSVSGQHAWMMNQQGHHSIMNTLSTNGTFVNGKRIHEASLRHGDRIRLGQAEFVFLTREPGPSRHRRMIAVLAVVAVVAALALAAWWLH